MHALVAVIAVTIMLSSIAHVVTLTVPPLGDEAAYDLLDTKASDILHILRDTPIESKYGKDELSAFVAECMNNNCTNLTGKLQKLLPPGAGYQFSVSNGGVNRLLVSTGEPTGEAASHSLAFEPAWSSTFLSTATSSLSPGDPLITYALPIYHSNVVTTGATTLTVRVNGEKQGGDYILTARAPLRAQPSTHGLQHTVSLTFVNDTGAPMPMLNLSGAGAHRLLLNVRVDGPKLDAGTTLTLHTPRGFTAIAPQEDNPGWIILENATDRNGSYVGSVIRARTTSDVTSTRTLALDAHYHGDVLDMYSLRAELSGNAHATAGLLVRAETHPSPPTLATPIVEVSAPSPLSMDRPGIFTLAVYAPVNHTFEYQMLQVRSVEIYDHEGAGIFGPQTTLTALSGPPGNWVVTPGRAIFFPASSSYVLNHSRQLNLSFQIAGSGVGGPSFLHKPYTTPVTFDTWTGSLLDRVGWGFVRQAILPADATYAGYTPTPNLPGATHPLITEGVYRNTPLPGRTTYNVSLLGSIESAIHGALISADDHRVTHGQNITASVNVQSLLFALAELGQRAGITLRIYPPWSGDQRVPIHTVENLDQGLLNSEATQVVLIDVNNDGYPDPVIGTTNGRVIAYDATTGLRMQGNSWTAPLAANQQGTAAASKITAMTLLRHDDEDLIVVATDSAGPGVVVLNKNLTQRWRSPPSSAGDFLHLDASTDLTGDLRPDILALRTSANTQGAGAYVYVFSPPLDGTQLWAVQSSPLQQDTHAFHRVNGTPGTLLAVPRIGPYGSQPGFYLADDVSFTGRVRIDHGSLLRPTIYADPTTNPEPAIKGVGMDGSLTSRLSATSVSALRRFVAPTAAVDDVLIGAKAGFLTRTNGLVLTQPIHRFEITASQEFVDADSRTTSASYALDASGRVIWTDDSWVTSFHATGVAPGSRAIAANAADSFWLVGDASSMWRSESTAGETPDVAREHLPAEKTLVTVTPIVTKDAIPYPLAANAHDLRDVWFRGNEGFVVGATCAVPVVCVEPALLHTVDGGVTWTMASKNAETLQTETGEPVTTDLHKVTLTLDGTGWIVGEKGTVLRKPAGIVPAKWTRLPPATTADLRDIACNPSDPDTCLVVGDNGTAFRITQARAADPVWENLTGRTGLPTPTDSSPIERIDFFSVGYAEPDRIYIGSRNMIFASFGGANWTTLPLDYSQGNGKVVNGLGDGTGFIFGGGANGASIWLLHDYGIQSRAQTTSFSDLLDGARISRVKLTGGNVTFAGQTVVVEVTDGTGWQNMGPITAATLPETDPRLPTEKEVAFGGVSNDLRFRIALNTSPAMTILSPHVRMLEFQVNYDSDSGPGSRTITIDFADGGRRDAMMTTANWNTAIGALHQPFIEEFWTRNVSGEVHDIQTGIDLTGDGKWEVWVATGDVLAANSPNHLSYAGIDGTKIVGSDNRVYYLNGANGNTTAISPSLHGPVKHIRLADHNNDGHPELVLAVTWKDDSILPTATFYALNSTTLQIIYSHSLYRNYPSDFEAGRVPSGAAAYLAGTRPVNDIKHLPVHLNAMHVEHRNIAWNVMPDEMGTYSVSTKVPQSWLYGPHVIEVEVEWRQNVTNQLGGIEEVLKSARFYDHFMVTMPNGMMPPSPIYNAKLLVWMRDWT